MLKLVRNTRKWWKRHLRQSLLFINVNELLKYLSLHFKKQHRFNLLRPLSTFTEFRNNYISEKEPSWNRRDPNIARGAALSPGHGLLSGDIGFHQRPSFCCRPSAVGSGGGCAKRGLERWQSAAVALWQGTGKTRWWFHFFWFSPLPGKIPDFDAYFSNGLGQIGFAGVNSFEKGIGFFKHMPNIFRHTMVYETQEMRDDGSL